MRYTCNNCGYKYDEEKGDPTYGLLPGIKFGDLPMTFVCPLCNLSKDNFKEEKELME